MNSNRISDMNNEMNTALPQIAAACLAAATRNLTTARMLVLLVSCLGLAPAVHAAAPPRGQHLPRKEHVRPANEREVRRHARAEEKAEARRAAHEKAAVVTPAVPQLPVRPPVVVLAPQVIVVPAPRTAVILEPNLRAADPSYQAEVDLLRDAYVTLSRAEHDYAGHRRAAMGETAHAAELLGIGLVGDGRGQVPQHLSDAHLRSAREFLVRARDLLAARGHREAVTHVDRAIHQVNLALRDA